MSARHLTALCLLLVLWGCYAIRTDHCAAVALGTKITCGSVDGAFTAWTNNMETTAILAGLAGIVVAIAMLI